MIKRIKNPHQADVLLFQEPQSIADWETMRDKVHKAYEAGQSFSGKTWAIKLLYGLMKSDNPSKIQYNILNESLADYPELAPEVRARYPHLKFTGGLPLFNKDHS